MYKQHKDIKYIFMIVLSICPTLSDFATSQIKTAGSTIRQRKILPIKYCFIDV